MRIQHTVLFRLVHEAGSAGEKSFLSYATAELGSIPGVEEFAVRRQVNPTTAFTHQFSMWFEDRAAYECYNEHPVHLAFGAERWDEEVVEYQDFDFETWN